MVSNATFRRLCSNGFIRCSPGLKRMSKAALGLVASAIRQRAIIHPLPTADLWHVLAVRANVCAVLEQLTVHRLLQSDTDALQFRHPVKHAMHEMVAVETVQHGHVERR